MANKIEAINIKKSFVNLDTLENVSITLEENLFVSIIGPSGCGKSTLFDIISGLEKPDSGKVLIDGENYNGKTGRVSYMHQKDLLLPWKTIIDNTCIPLLIKGLNIKQAREMAKSYFNLFGLSGFENYYPNQLSGGMKQRASLLRAYLFSNDIMLLDEPFGGLDAVTRRNMQLWLLDLLKNFKSSILFITHSVDEAIFLSDKIYLFSKRPAVVKATFEVNLKRPRDYKTFTSDQFNKIKEELLDLLMKEK
ncbi:MAG: ABC transporter ATP-binding protein [Actinobacteria bacterium]|nr:ABC transporter ATP-binding protein [Cyanobacteriota bacterium]MCL5772612.1 ABC transporter ATP-binding protein [Actinomycetota bacterium]